MTDADETPPSADETADYTESLLVALTNSDWNQWICPGAPLQIEVKGHLNANIMA